MTQATACGKHLHNPSSFQAWSITSPGHETPLASGVSTNVSVDVDTRQHDSEADVDARQHDPGQDQDQPAFNCLWNNQYAVLTELDM
eukprot:scaffold6191_cov114-Amphora_coffeaeformis.AAC.1